MTGRDVLITGLGAVSPLGSDVAALWNAVSSGTLGTGPVTQFPTEGFTSRHGGEVRGFDPAPHFHRHAPDRLCRATQLAVAAARLAWSDAGLDGQDVGLGGERAGVVMGTVMANRHSLERKLTELARNGTAPADMDAHDVAWIAEAPALELGLAGGNIVVGTACASGVNAVAVGAERVARGEVDVCLAGGADEITPATFMMFSLFKSLSPDVVRPFDRDRKGLLLSEGAGVLVLEAAERARARRARVYGRVAGWGNSCDAFDMTRSHPEGVGARLAMQAALADACLTPADIDLVSAHGTGTPVNDTSEAYAIRAVFGARADHLPVTAWKSMLGHAQGASGAIETIISLLAIEHGLIPPTINLRDLDPSCTLDVVANSARRARVRTVLKNAFGFGGNTSAIVLAQA